MDKTITLPAELVQAILNYLQDQPFKSVFQLVQAIIAVANNQPAQDTPEDIKACQALGKSV